MVLLLNPFVALQAEGLQLVCLDFGDPSDVSAFLLMPGEPLQPDRLDLQLGQFGEAVWLVDVVAV